MTQQTDSCPASALYQKIARISARLEQVTPQFDGAVSVISPAHRAESDEQSAKPWGKAS
ncbi:hypothetical protein [Rothia sp. P5766]|uniref:hypothetical protein n=1 Tax=Rothia sp. P5766 TaxID=3402656 RepID=UPI003ADC4EC6